MSTTKKIFFRSQKYTGKAKFNENFPKKNLFKNDVLNYYSGFYFIISL